MVKVGRIKKTLCILMLVFFVASVTVTSVSAARDGYGKGKFDRFDRFDKFDKRDKFDRFDKFDKFDRFDKFDKRDRFDRFDKFDKFKFKHKCFGRDRCDCDFGWDKCSFFGFDFFGKDKCWNDWC